MTFAVTTTPRGPQLIQPVTCADIHNLGIASSSSNKDLAWKLINFLTTSPDVITTFLIPEGGMLPRKSYDTQARLYSRFYADAISQEFIRHYSHDATSSIWAEVQSCRAGSGNGITGDCTWYASEAKTAEAH